MSGNDQHVAALEALYALPAFTPEPTSTPQLPGDLAGVEELLAQLQRTGRAPMAQGDVFLIPYDAPAPIGGRPLTTGRGAVLVRDRIGRARHVLTDPQPADQSSSEPVVWQRIRGDRGLIGLLTVPAGASVELLHRGRDHHPLHIGPGTWAIRRQQAFTGTDYRRITD